MKKVDFLFEYEGKQRELDSVCLIAAYLKKQGYTVGLVNSWQAMYEELPKYDAEVMVLSACYNDNVYNSFSGLARQFKKVVNLQWEQIRTEDMYSPHEKVFGDFEGKGLTTRHACWGENEKNWLNDFWGIDPSYTKVAGYPILDFYREEFHSLLIPREKLFPRYGIDPDKTTLLFVSSFCIVGMPATELFGDEDYLKDYMSVSYRSQQILLDWFEKLLREYPELQLIYRFHPAEKSNSTISDFSRKYPNFFAVSELPIRHWIAACDKLLNWSSTSLVEMYYSGKETYILRPIPILPKDDMIVFKKAQFIQTYDEFVEAMKHYPGFPVPEKSILAWYSITGQPAYQRIGDWLIETFHSTEYSSPPVDDISHHSMLVRELAGVLRSIPVRLGLAALAKRCIPNTAISARLQKMAGDVAHRKEKYDKNGYMYQKYRQNALKPGEAEALIETYQRIWEGKGGFDEGTDSACKHWE